MKIKIFNKYKKIISNFTHNINITFSDTKRIKTTELIAVLISLFGLILKSKITKIRQMIVNII